MRNRNKKGFFSSVHEAIKILGHEFGKSECVKRPPYMGKEKKRSFFRYKKEEEERGRV